MNAERRTEEDRKAIIERHSYVRIIERGQFGTVVEAIDEKGKKRAIKLVDFSDGKYFAEMDILSREYLSYTSSIFLVNFHGRWADDTSLFSGDWKDKFIQEFKEKYQCDVPQRVFAYSFEYCEGEWDIFNFNFIF